MKIAIAILLFIKAFVFASGFPEYYYSITNPVKQRAEFIKIISPMVTSANKKIVQERRFAEIFFKKASMNAFRNIKQNDLKRLLELKEKYRIKSIYNKKEYLFKIDVIPPSLAIAQAAVESAWGKSRFTKEANNIFGIWTWGEDGLVPELREANEIHKVKIYSSLEESVSDYMLNLNRLYAYATFRDLRQRYRSKKEIFFGLNAANTMLKYSILKEKYVKILKVVIQKNKLRKFDNI